MKYVKLFNWFKKEDGIDSICKKYGIKNYTINKNGSIDVNGYVEIVGKTYLTELPIKFDSVGSFNINNNKLITLEGAPNYVDVDFTCLGNKLITLEGAPNYVGGEFDCRNNKLTTLKGAPNHIGSDFYCGDNNILTFEGIPNYIGGYFYCYDNPIYYIGELFRDYSKLELLNDYDALRIEDGRGVCILSRLNGFLENIGKAKLTDKQKEDIGGFYEIR